MAGTESSDDKSLRELVEELGAAVERLQREVLDLRRENEELRNRPQELVKIHNDVVCTHDWKRIDHSGFQGIRCMRCGNEIPDY